VARNSTVRYSTVRYFTVRFCLEVAALITSTVLFVMTLVWPTWIELMFHADPDHGSGLLEVLIVLVALTASLWLFAAARREYRRVRRDAVTGSEQA
jgi:hypothetical protein